MKGSSSGRQFIQITMNNQMYQELAFDLLKEINRFQDKDTHLILMIAQQTINILK